MDFHKEITLVGIGVIVGWAVFPLFVQISAAHLTGTPHLDHHSPVAGSILFGIILFGLLHGLDPSHGWPVAILYSMRSRKPMISGLLSSSIIAGAHFVSSIVVVIVYLFITNLIIIPELYLRFGAAIALGALAYVFWREKEENYIGDEHRVENAHSHGSNIDVVHKQSQTHSHDYNYHRHELDHHREHHDHNHHHSHHGMDQKKAVRSLKSIAVFAVVLGFAHEEEFVILALAAGGVDPLVLMFTYATSVAAVIIGITLLSLKAYKHIQDRVMRYSKYYPKITACLLAAMAIAFAAGVMTPVRIST